jgi:hypothetical protein
MLPRDWPLRPLAWEAGRFTCPLLSPSYARGTADWFGVSKDSDSTQKWQRKSIRHCSQRYGKLKPQVIRELDLPSQDNVSLTSTETPPPLYVGPCQLGMQKVCLLLLPPIGPSFYLTSSLWGWAGDVANLSREGSWVLMVGKAVRPMKSPKILPGGNLGGGKGHGIAPGASIL